MFTGLIQAQGIWRSVAGARRVRVEAPSLAAQLAPGDSVAVNGVCLTALEIAGGTFAADLAEETLARTSLGKLQPGASVNLELAARADSRLGGHMVQGHVDGTATIVSLVALAGGDWVLTIDVPPPLTRYMVEKGSITVDGISLTIAAIADARARIAIIPHTLANTNLKSAQPGDLVNIEVDVMAKYAERAAESGLSVERLMAEGF